MPGPLSEEVGLGHQMTLAREGLFVSAARGQAIRGKSGRWFFVFDPDSSGRVLPPMVLVPCLNLAAVERLAERSPAGTRMLITGQVLVYQGLNYLLTAAPPLPVRAEEATPATPATPAPPQPPSAASSAEPANDGKPAPRTDAPSSGGRTVTGEPSIDDIVARLDKAASRVAATSPQRIAAPTSAPDQQRPGAGSEAAGGSPASRALIVPGVLASRRGRITRAADGSMVFQFDSSPTDGPSGPLVLLPCQNLASIEQLSERAGEGATYTVTGDIQAYRGRNYLLVRSYRTNRPTDTVLPAQ